jgi:ABC-type phosphate transport system substrate-binding protein
MKKIILTASVLILAAFHANAQVAVIAHKGVSVSSLSASAASDIFTLSTKEWKDGSAVVVFDLKAEGVTRTKFYDFIGKSPIELKKTWMRVQLSGEGKAPAVVASEEEMIQKVASTPGAIGFVSASKASGEVKILATIH